MSKPILEERAIADQRVQPDRPSVVGDAKVASKRRRRLPLHLSLRDLFWMALLAAVLMTWYRDRQALLKQLQAFSGNIGTSWSVAQILGPPDTPMPGDQSTAWAPETQDSQKEWVIVEFAQQTDLATVEVFETYNPGAVSRICAVNARGVETELWRGVDPAPPGAALSRSRFPIAKGTRTRRIKIYLDSPKVPGWNEIDAVALHDRDGTIRWATDAWASSAFGDNQPLPRWFWP